ncbi:hypothetical protein [Streptomyces hawaiiensis]|uniref:hypothetical protein n=1 Tax=Streptomyces hawaiiensis TaxID=67305 RepID=UPI00365C5F7A
MESLGIHAQELPPPVRGPTLKHRRRDTFLVAQDGNRRGPRTLWAPEDAAVWWAEARDAGAGDQEMRGIIADGFREIYLQDGGARAMDLSDVAISDNDYLNLDY